MMWLFRVFALAVFMCGLFGTAHAQMVPSSGGSEDIVIPDPSPNDVKEFLCLLGDPSVQEWIKDSADEVGSLESAPVLTFREQVDARLAGIAARAQSLALAWNILPRMPVVMAEVWESELTHAQKVRSATYVLTFLLIGLGLEWLYRQFMKFPLLRVEQSPKDAPTEKFMGAVMRAAIIFAGLGIFAVGSMGRSKALRGTRWFRRLCSIFW